MMYRNDTLFLTHEVFAIMLCYCSIRHKRYWQGYSVHYTVDCSRQTTNKENKMDIDRTEVARALAKAIAYKQCGKQEAAEMWARKLVELLECAGILK